MIIHKIISKTFSSILQKIPNRRWFWVYSYRRKRRGNQSIISSEEKELLQDIFGKSEQSIGVSYLRLSIGASDLNSSVFSYDDVPAGQTDEDLSEFSLAKDQPVIDMLKEILAINPDIKIISAPWSPPVWMKDNGNSIGGSLKTRILSSLCRIFREIYSGNEEKWNHH